MAKGTTPDTAPTESSLPRIEIKNADQFQSILAGGFNWMEDNAKVVVAILIVAILASVGYAGMTWVNHRQESAAQDAYYAVEAKFTKAKEGFDQAKYKALMPTGVKDDPSQPKAVTASGDLSKDYGSTIDDLAKVAKDYAGTSAGAQAGLLAGDIYINYKQPEKAAEVTQIAATHLKPNQVLQQLSAMMWGNALAAKGDCEGAITRWDDILKNDAAQFLHPDANLRTGLCLEKTGHADRALEMYRKAAASAESAAGSTARGFLRALEAKAPVAAPKGNG